MPHRIDQINRPVVFAHRGASAYAPENTMAAFQLAIDQGADRIELDAKLTSDGQIVVIHDQTDPLNWIRIKRRLPECPVALLTLPGPAGRLMSGGLSPLLEPKFLPPFYTNVSESSLKWEYKHGRRVNANAWTVNDPAEIARLYRMGIDGIITDDPLLAKQVTEEK